MLSTSGGILLAMLFHMMTAMLQIKTVGGKKQEVLDILQSLKESLRFKHDCAACMLYEAHGEKDSILYLELWQTKQSLHQHIQSDLYRRILAVMELAKETPQVFFQESDTIHGMELIAALRKEKR